MGQTTDEMAEELGQLKAENAELLEALVLTDLHLRYSDVSLIEQVRAHGINVPPNLWPDGHLDCGRVNAWVKGVRRAAIAKARGK